MIPKITYTLFGFCAALVLLALYNSTDDQLIHEQPQASDIQKAERLYGLHFQQAHRDSMLAGIRSNLETYEALRAQEISNDVWPAVQFNPLPAGFEMPGENHETHNWQLPESVTLPESGAELAFMSVAELSSLIRSGQLSSVTLTELYLERIRTYDPELRTVITLTADLALRQAERADSLIQAGVWLGPLHGIPYGSKDLLALEGYPTTWGAVPYKDQMIDETATVISRLEVAGAVHLAKLSLGALAWGDVWFDATTRSPWNTEVGASGSSAGSAAATAAGLVAFAIGSETLGSIVSPSTRNGVTGLRPTYGRVSRHGAMALSWSMDKIGPITRSVRDAALVFDAIYGADPYDPSLIDAPFVFDADLPLSEIRIGYQTSAFELPYPNREHDLAALETLRNLGADLIPVEIPQLAFNAMDVILSVEAAAAFDDLTRSGRDSLMVRQLIQAWPNVFRTARFVPAVEYIQANRARKQLIENMHKALQGIDVYVSPSFAGGNLGITNLTGHPAVVVPNGFTETGMPVSITFTAQLFEEGKLLRVADSFQQATDFHKTYPPDFFIQ
ncbi:Asp-tRNAAsn/Glu-tRNAGln amidotransferase A subunit [Cyclonatronum proteinivorum]|uniref:Asp-tRNAAsn/Glu-tRNAGln amidotransferase A subunit n=1 Tax=Cyclonatronum proteinivorum TaxID=1457365 RepID=A0A345UGX8_9BACT|nr:amidase [Cyclonatronum proteinivorum]AXI99729.1 Asp-tRNAAsn/Glu-tRNAGln amidotransferase A subunit [Cyclonatronum proteinivorum]